MAKEFLKNGIGHAGMTSGSTAASGARCRKRVTWKQERASAIALSTPAIWVMITFMLYLAAQKYSIRMSTMTSGNLVEPFFHMFTMVWLSLANQVSHKTIKVYLAGIRLEHLERGFQDPTKDELLHLLCNGIKRSQGNTKHIQLSITINILCTLKGQLRNDSSYSIFEKECSGQPLH